MGFCTGFFVASVFVKVLDVGATGLVAFFVGLAAVIFFFITTGLGIGFFDFIGLTGFETSLFTGLVIAFFSAGLPNLPFTGFAEAAFCKGLAGFFAAGFAAFFFVAILFYFLITDTSNW
jgi:hypothetical protein